MKSKLETVKKIVIKELNSLKYLPGGYMVGFLDKVLSDANIEKKNPIPQEYFDIIEDSIYEEIYGGCEPEFQTKEEYDSFYKLINELNSNHYKFTTDSENSYYNESPYKDSSIPYLKYYPNEKNR